MSTQSLFDQPSLNFPQSLTEKYRPRAIDDFAGLEKPKNIMRKLAAKPFESAWLFVGPSGTGKTTMGLALADAIPAELHHIPSQDCNLENIERVRRICQYVPMAGKRFHLVLVDEADRMSSAAQISLLSKLDATNFPPNTIFVFTCNSTDGLEPRFLSRCHTVEFSSYGISKDVVILLHGKASVSHQFGFNSHQRSAYIVRRIFHNSLEIRAKIACKFLAPDALKRPAVLGIAIM